MKHRRKLYIFSAVIMLAGLVSLLVQGLNEGIDFTSGNSFTLQMNRQVTLDDLDGIRQELASFNLQGSVVRRIGDDLTQVEIRTSLLEDSTQERMLKALEEKFPITETSVTVVDPAFSRELARRALLALGVALAGMLVYISWRFEFRSAVTAIAALLHDAVVVMGVFSLFQVEVDSAFVAAILTIVGYSINDTIILFDRVRENFKGVARKEDASYLINLSIWQTLGRTINTGLTTLILVTVLFILGGVTIKPFALALLIGISFGTYSSIFVASALWLDWRLSAKQGAGPVSRSPKPAR
ncbi:MAG: protein translocase subunit SecF [Firmicutes bacterium]|nr:protein translocase subunit SecF [Bacillota bacterium]